MHRDVVIVGAGPAGLLTSIHVKTRDVLLLEEHVAVGRPRHCAGIVGRETINIVKSISPRLLDGAYSRILFQVERENIELEFRDPIMYHIDRPGLEDRLAEISESKGHIIIYKSRAKPGPLGIVKTPIGLIKYNLLVVSDGAYSIFRKTYIGQREDFLYGYQVLTRNYSVSPDTVHIYYSQDIPGFFAWFIPIREDYLQIGLASKLANERILYKITRRVLGIELRNVFERFGGLIPIHKPVRNPVLWGRIVFHGDAVPLTKPYTGGGLYHIFKLSPILGSLIDTDRIEDYKNTYTRLFYTRTLIEHYITKILRKTRYHLPVEVVRDLHRVSFIDYRDFDNHFKILVKTIPIIPLIPLLSLFRDTA